MTSPNVSDTTRTLRIEDGLREESTITVTNTTFGMSLTARVPGHTVTCNGDNFHITLFSLTPNGHLELDYNNRHYTHEVPNETHVTFTGDNVVFTDAM
ncbi:MAG: hypothetical protein LN569_03420 [Rickettsia endosymbiont of Labidopullus appendiculatus]|nr:hypothetical protein [Rickettsia endosymbiont of Labidopullus appendiculatus]